MNSKRKGKNGIIISIVYMLCFILIIAANASALSLHPSRVNLDYEEIIVHENKFILGNSDKINALVDITKEGDLAQYVEIQNSTELNIGKSTSEIPFKLNIPMAVLLKPGKNEAKIIFTLKPKKITRHTVVLPAIIAQIRVNAPYPDKYIEPAVSINAENNNVIVDAVLFNRGLEISDAIVNAIITNSKGVVDRLQKSNISLEKKERKQIRLQTSLENGEYNALIKIDYGNGEQTINKRFSVGNIVVKITDVTHSGLFKGDIVVFAVSVENEWDSNVELIEVHGKVKSDGKTIHLLRSNPVSLESKQNTTLALYWDTKDFKKGEYEIEFSTNYNSKKIITAKLNEREADKKSIIDKAGDISAGISSSWKNLAKIFAIIAGIIAAIAFFAGIIILIIKLRRTSGKDDDKGSKDDDDDGDKDNYDEHDIDDEHDEYYEDDDKHFEID